MVLLRNDTGTPGTNRKIYSEEADGETRTGNPSVINCMRATAIELTNSKAIARKELSLSCIIIYLSFLNCG